MPSNEEFYALKAQRDLLFAGLKKIATSDSTPDSIKIYLNSLAKKVVATKSVSFIENKPFAVGDIVMTTNNKICKYRIEKLYEDLGAQMCTLRTVWVKDNQAPADGVHNGVPVSLLKHSKGA